MPFPPDLTQPAEWARVLSVFAHELRTPAGVMAGCVRLLEGGALGPDDRKRALEQMARAAQQVGRLASQASDLGKWLSPDPGRPPARLRVGDWVRRAADDPARTSIVHIALAPEVESAEVSASSGATGALIDSLRCLLTATARENGEEAVTLAAAIAPGGAHGLVRIGKQSGFPVSPGDAALNGLPLLEAGGLGLGAIVAMAVFAAHSARVWSSPDRREMGIEIPLAKS